RPRLRWPAWFDRADIWWTERGTGAGFLLRIASGDAGICADVPAEAGRGDPCGGNLLSRPLAFRWAGRARKRLCRSGPGAIRLAQPRAGIVAEGRAGDERARRRPDHAAGAAWGCADRRLDSRRAAASRRRYRDAP